MNLASRGRASLREAPIDQMTLCRRAATSVGVAVTVAVGQQAACGLEEL